MDAITRKTLLDLNDLALNFFPIDVAIVKRSRF